MPNIRTTKRSTKGPVVAPSEQEAIAPTAQVTIDKLHDETKRLNQETAFLKEENHLLKEENRLLKEEKDFLREQLSKKEHGSTSKSAQGSKKMRKDCSSDSSSSSESCSDSDSASEPVKKRKKRRKHKKASAFGKRVKCPEDVLHRYKAVLKEFQRTRSITVSCEKLKVDRNTIALTAVIAEVMIAAQGQDIGPLPDFREDETLNQFSLRCKAFLDGKEELREKISELKKSSELLPIKQKFRK